jgi:hypothetical protein
MKGQKTMRVIFLGSAYFGYVYAYAFNPSALSDSADAVAQQEWRDLVGEEESRPAPKLGVSVRERLAAWLGQRREDATC